MSTKKEYYRGVRFAPYDIVREFLVALVVITAIVVIFAGALSSPDVAPLTLKGIASGKDSRLSAALKGPLAFIQASISELNGTSDTATYGPPYNNQSGSVQSIGPISLQRWFGVRIPINTAQQYVLGPLRAASASDPPLKHALKTFEAASASQQAKWEMAYSNALAKATVKGTKLSVPACSCGPVSLMMARELALGESGAMDGLLLTSGHFYQTDYTRPLLFTQNTGALDDLAATYNLQGSTWGVMNETGNYPGQAWLWLFTMLYQIPPYTTAWSANADLMAVLTITILTLILLFLPWIPGLNRLPRYLPVYRLIWKDYYREQRQAARSQRPPRES